MAEWKWFDDLKAKWAQEDLGAEAARSLDRDPGRWSWGRKVEEVLEDQPTITRHASGFGRRSHTARGDQRHRTGKGNIEAGQSGERTRWTQRQYDAARRDLERQQQEAQEERQALREQAAREVRERVREANDAVRRGDPPPGWRR